MKKRIFGGVLTVVGFILSPLSWWNDFVINIPLAYIFALPFGFLSKTLFLPAMIIRYWLTNIAGFLLMHLGIQKAVKKEDKYGVKELKRDIIISILYTILIIILVLTGVLRFPTEY